MDDGASEGVEDRVSPGNGESSVEEGRRVPTVRTSIGKKEDVISKEGKKA